MDFHNLSLFELKDRPQHLLTLANWHHHQWSLLNPGFTLEDRIGAMEQHLSEATVPTTLVLEADNKLLGSAALVECDMDTHPELSPWLASVYVAPPFRQRGFGQQLVEAVVQFAAQHSFEHIHLFTTDREDFYLKRGWNLFEKEEYRGQKVSLMRFSCLDRY